VTRAAQIDGLRQIIALAQEQLDQLLADDAAAPSFGAEEDDEADFAADNMIELGEAARRFGVAKDTLRFWARTEGIGKKSRGRWFISIPKLQRRRRRPC
jgi:hypothetical protein